MFIPKICIVLNVVRENDFCKQIPIETHPWQRGHWQSMATEGAESLSFGDMAAERVPPPPQGRPYTPVKR